MMANLRSIVIMLLMIVIVISLIILYMFFWLYKFCRLFLFLILIRIWLTILIMHIVTITIMNILRNIIMSINRICSLFESSIIRNRRWIVIMILIYMGNAKLTTKILWFYKILAWWTHDRSTVTLFTIKLKICLLFRVLYDAVFIRLLMMLFHLNL